MFLILLAMLWPLRALADVCPSSAYVKLRADSVGDQYFSLAPYGLQPPFKSELPRLLHRASPPDGCATLASIPPPQSIILALRGNCSFLEKATAAAQANASGLIVINNSSDCLYLAREEDSTGSLSAMFVATAPLDATTQALLTATSASATSAALAPPVATYTSVRVQLLDPAAFVLLCLAVATIVIAAAWTGSDFKRALALREHAAAAQGSPGGALSTDPAGSNLEQAVITVPAVLTFVAVTSVAMFILFFVINKYIFYVFLALFSYGAAMSTAVSLHALVAEFRPGWLRIAWALRRSWTVSLVDVAAGGISIAAVATWLACRHASWAWMIQNALGMCFIAFLLQTVALPSARVASVFLAALFCYDVFMVFITPLFMPRGDSVMVRVATGGDMHEVLPMLLVVPRLLPPLHSHMMLGYGDIAVPGLLIMMLRRFDVATGRGIGFSSYTQWAIIAYVVGLFFTDAALATSFGGSKGQPALLYLVPCTLGTMWILAWLRGDVVVLWKGQLEDFKDHASGEEEGAEAGGSVTDEERSGAESRSLDVC